jgi:hypothetical protein
MVVVLKHITCYPKQHMHIQTNSNPIRESNYKRLEK